MLDEAPRMVIAAPMVQVPVRCHYCSRFRAPDEVIQFSGSVSMCLQCHEWHQKALDRISVDPHCPDCQRPLDDAHGNCRVYLVAKDGEYQALCKPCASSYVARRRDLYPQVTRPENLSA